MQIAMTVKEVRTMRRCVIIGGAPIENYERIRGYLGNDDFYIFCDSGLKHCDGG